METKQTAVEWLYDEMKHIIPNGFLNKFEQAKQMEKEQITKAYNSAIPFHFGEQYYNETYSK